MVADPKVEDPKAVTLEALKSLVSAFGEQLIYVSRCCNKLFVGIKQPRTCGACSLPVVVHELPHGEALEDVIVHLN